MEFPRAKDGTICTFNVHEFALMDISFRAADVRRTWPDWPAYSCLERCKDASMAGAKGDFQSVDQEPSGG